MTLLDEVEMNISWQLITHPQNANLWPYSFLNNTTHIKVARWLRMRPRMRLPLLAPGLFCFVDAERRTLL